MTTNMVWQGQQAPFHLTSRGVMHAHVPKRNVPVPLSSGFLANGSLIVPSKSRQPYRRGSPVSPWRARETVFTRLSKTPSSFLCLCLQLASGSGRSWAITPLVSAVLPHQMPLAVLMLVRQLSRLFSLGWIRLRTLSTASAPGLCPANWVVPMSVPVQMSSTLTGSPVGGVYRQPAAKVWAPHVVLQI